MRKVAIVTVNFNGLTDTADLLESLPKLDTRGIETTTIVIDNGSANSEAEKLQKAFPKIKVVSLPDNTGSAGGFNEAIRQGLSWGADAVLLLNNDTVVKDKNLLKSMVTTLYSEDKIGAVSSKIYFAPGTEYKKELYTKKDQGNVLWYAGGSMDWDNIFANHRGIDEVDTDKYDSVEEVDFLNAACILMKKEIFDKGIFFDDSLFAYFDDTDFNQKLTKAGFKKVYDGRAGIYHKVSRTAGIGSPISDYYLTRNRLIFGMRYASARTKFALLREALRFSLNGRPAQKKGVADFFFRRLGKRT